jgi:hypothetical protein
VELVNIEMLGASSGTYGQQLRLFAALRYLFIVKKFLTWLEMQQIN